MNRRSLNALFAMVAGCGGPNSTPAPHAEPSAKPVVPSPAAKQPEAKDGANAKMPLLAGPAAGPFKVLTEYCAVAKKENSDRREKFTCLTDGTIKHRGFEFTGTWKLDPPWNEAVAVAWSASAGALDVGIAFKSDNALIVEDPQGDFHPHEKLVGTHPLDLE